jgi:predicted amidohydrolase YtcJ
MWTSGGAAVLDWPELGALHTGNYADLVVVDRDPLTCALDDLPNVVVRSTVTAGRTAFPVA